MLKKCHTLQPTIKMSPFHTLPGEPISMALETHDHMCFGMGETVGLVYNFAWSSSYTPTWWLSDHPWVAQGLHPSVHMICHTRGLISTWSNDHSYTNYAYVAVNPPCKDNKLNRRGTYIIHYNFACSKNATPSNPPLRCPHSIHCRACLYAWPWKHMTTCALGWVRPLDWSILLHKAPLTLPHDGWVITHGLHKVSIPPCTWFGIISTWSNDHSCTNYAYVAANPPCKDNTFNRRGA